MVTRCAPASSAPSAIESVSSVLPEYETANTRVRGPTKPGVRYCFSTMLGTGTEPLPTVVTTSPTIPEPPIPQKTT
jgi:hypothetical protein